MRRLDILVINLRMNLILFLTPPIGNAYSSLIDDCLNYNFNICSPCCSWVVTVGCVNLESFLLQGIKL